jgi:hypothetical protein
MKKIILLFLLVFAKPVFSQSLQSIVQVYSDGSYLKLVKSNGEILHIPKKSIKMELRTGTIILYDNSLSDHMLTNKEVTLYALTYTTVTVPLSVSSSALLTALIALINI